MVNFKPSPRNQNLEIETSSSKLSSDTYTNSNLKFGRWPAWHRPKRLWESSDKSSYYGKHDIHAGNRLTWLSKINMSLIFLNCILLLILVPGQTFLIIWSLLILCSLWQCLLTIFGTNIKARRNDRKKYENRLHLAKNIPPILVSVICPVYEEKDSLHGIIDAIANMNWPKDQLELIIALESDDLSTIRTAKLYEKLPWVKLSVTPPSKVTTKPNALNYAMQKVKGDIVGLYDVEDRPDPNQLNELALKMYFHPEIDCFQAPLSVIKREKNWLVSQFHDEYAVQFQLYLPAQAKLGFPIALGGTSCFIRRQALDHVRGWDALNVTEDADLGYRLYLNRLKIGVLSLPTQEVMPSTLNAWTKQRSRWLKGFLVTSITVCRHIGNANKEQNKWGMFLCLMHLMSALLSAALYVPVSLTFVILLFAGLYKLDFHLILFVLPIVSRAISLAKIYGPFAAGRALISPFYWVMHFLAFGLALYDYFHKPYHWRKTHHPAVNFNPNLCYESSPNNANAHSRRIKPDNHDLRDLEVEQTG